MLPRRLKVRIATLATLALAPVVFLVGVGFYYLWDRGWSFYTYWPMAACWLAAYLLGWYWTRRAKAGEKLPDDVPPPDYWTDRDKEAWKVVEAHAAATQTITTDEFSDVDRYAKDAEALALKIARVYHPSAADPFGHLTLPEILTCGELVCHDMAKLVEKYVPGSHLMSVNDLKRIRDWADQASTWYPRLRNLYWVASALFNPVKTGLQVAATKAGLAPAFAGMQANIMLWFHTAYVKELGRYLIELNSGRLRVGARRYQELMALHLAPPIEFTPPAAEAGGGRVEGERGRGGEEETKPGPPSSPPSPPPVTVAIVGPVKAGKSSLVNALLGETRAATDVLPLTPGATRYTLRQPGLPTLTLIDTAGFGREGPTDIDVKNAVAAAEEADILLLVVPARSAARKPEADFLDRVRAGLAARPHLKMPPVLLVLSHIDLLTPAAEWAPPYDWRAGTRPKEVTIRDAAAAAQEQFGGRVAGVIPVCTAAGKEMGVTDDLLPAVAAQLGEARGVGLLRALHLEASAEKVKRVAKQVLNAGGQLLKAFWESAGKQ